ncbi:MAG: hypothetical protein ACI9H8_001342 [Lysobacterales bacterium]|jgi:hypothetical protein
MIRKGLRPGFRLALDFGREEGGYRKVLPFRRSWLAIGILLAFDIAFSIPAVTTFQQAASEWGKFDDLFDLVSALFLSAWLLGWSIAPLLMTTILALLLFGREVIKLSHDKFQIILGLPGIGLKAEYDISKMRNLSLDLPIKSSRHSWRGSHISFDYGANSGQFGSNINEENFAAIKNSIAVVGGTSIRAGDAKISELKGDWEPEVWEDHEAPVEPVSFDPVVEKDPVTMGSLSTITLILANLIPLFGAAFLEWNLGTVMVLYWAESAVIGFFNVCKIVVIGRWFALLAGPFFIAHFGAFMAVHFMFIYGIFVEGMEGSSGGDLQEVAQMFIGLWPALTALFASHAFSFFNNFLGRKEYSLRKLKGQMGDPYVRIVAMHMVLIFGGGLTLILGEATPVLIVVIGLKIWFDLRAHLKERQ